MNKLLLIKLIWFFVNILWLVFILYRVILFNEEDIDIIFYWGEIILTFPSSFLMVLLEGTSSFILYTYLNELYESFLSTEPTLLVRSFKITIVWIFYTLFNYIQWFILFPKLYKYFKNQRKKI